MLQYCIIIKVLNAALQLPRFFVISFCIWRKLHSKCQQGNELKIKKWVLSRKYFSNPGSASRLIRIKSSWYTAEALLGSCCTICVCHLFIYTRHELKRLMGRNETVVLWWVRPEVWRPQSDIKFKTKY